jgi:hypothetical protein
MSEWMRRVLESKRGARRRFAARPFSEKVKLLENFAIAVWQSPQARYGVIISICLKPAQSTKANPRTTLPG